MRPLRLGVTGYDCRIFKSREIFRVDIVPTQENVVHVHNREGTVALGFREERARKVIQHYNLNRFGKPRTYVFGKFDPDTKQIALEGGGELSPVEQPNW